jgi:hypothetical protein
MRLTLSCSLSSRSEVRRAPLVNSPAAICSFKRSAI